jgi:hypothetical protein
MSGFHLAQINVARMFAPLSDPVMAGFVARLDEINALADGSPGFVWRLQTNSGNATGIEALGDPSILVNMSVWESVEALNAYVFKSQHAELLRDRKKWFQKFDGPYYALWWVVRGHLPSVAEGEERLRRLAERGATADAFWFGQRFAPPGGTVRV